MDMDALIDELYVRVRKRLIEMGYIDREGGLSDNRQKTEHKKKLSKRVITERDIRDAWEENVTCIVAQERAIVTDLAKEYAGKKSIRLIREGKDSL